MDAQVTLETVQQDTFMEKWNSGESHSWFRWIGKRDLKSRLRAWRARNIFERPRILFSFLRGVPEGSKVLDFGSGASHFTFYMAREMGLDVVGLDISNMAVRSAQRINKLFSYKCTFVQGDCQSLPLRDGAFDALFSADVVEHVSNPWAAVHEIARVLKKGGTASVLVQTEGYRRNRLAWRYYICRQLGCEPWVEEDLHVGLLSEQELESSFGKCGLRIVRKEYSPENHMIFNFWFVAPRKLEGLLKKYPLLEKNAMVRIIQGAIQVQKVLGKALAWRLVNSGVVAVLEMIVTALIRRDYGGIYYQLEKAA